MASGMDRRAVLPEGLKAERVQPVDDRVMIHVRPVGGAAACPRCGKISRRVNSQYERRLADLPAHLSLRRPVVRNGTAGGPTAWLDEAATSEIASFTRGFAADQAAVTAALTEPWSNRQTEGPINRPKTLKRQMYGRANIELLKARLVAAS